MDLYTFDICDMSTGEPVPCTAYTKATNGEMVIAHWNRSLPLCDHRSRYASWAEHVAMGCTQCTNHGGIVTMCEHVLCGRCGGEKRMCNACGGYVTDDDDDGEDAQVQDLGLGDSDLGDDEDGDSVEVIWSPTSPARSVSLGDADSVDLTYFSDSETDSEPEMGLSWYLM